MAYIIFIFILLSGRFNLYIRFIFTAAGIILFVLLTGFQPAVLRSAVMALAIMTAGITNRSTNIFNSLALSALLILVLDPAELFLPGFQLSYAAVFSIAYLYPVFKQEADKYKFKRNRLKKLILFCGVSVAAQVGTFPFVFYYFSKLSIISVISNLIVVPLTGIILGTVFVTIITAPLVPAAGIIFASANNLFCNFLFKTIEITGNPQFSFIWVRSFTLSDSIVFYLILVSFLCFLKKITSIKKKILYTLLSCASVILFTSLNDSDLLDENYLNCYMIDAGQGDAYLIKFPGGETALIDAGETTENFDTGERIIIPLMNHLDISRIDYAFISHMDADHYSGFVSLLKNGYIKTLYKPPPDTSDRDRRFEKFLKMCNINPVYYNGQIIKTGGGRIYILAHGVMHWNKMTSNDRSQVMIIAYGGKSILFTGDAGIKAENYYIRQFGTLLQSDILKVSHHGSGYATSDEFLSVIKPAYSLISAGEKNKFGHPSEAVLARLKNAGSEVCRTDIEGGVLLRSDGYFINKINWKEK